MRVEMQACVKGGKGKGAGGKEERCETCPAQQQGDGVSSSNRSN